MHWSLTAAAGPKRRSFEPCVWPGGAGDPTQGALGDCWFIAAMSLLATRDDALAALFCGMGRTGPCARGVYAVRFCKGAPAPRDWVVGVGRHMTGVIAGSVWHYVIVDDRLPRSSNDAILYAKSKQKEEWWVSILEKAYAKLHGSYDALIGTSVCSRAHA